MKTESVNPKPAPKLTFKQERLVDILIGVAKRLKSKDEQKAQGDSPHPDKTLPA